MRLLPFGVLLLLAGTVQAAEPPLDNTAEHLRRSQEYYQAERYDDAIVELKTAYKMNPLPRLHCNLAQCYRKAGKQKEALDYFDLCLRTDPNLTPEERGQIETSIRETRVEMTRPKPPPPHPVPVYVPPPPKPPEQPPVVQTPTPTTQPPVVADTRPVYKKAWFWVVIGGSLLVVGAVTAGAVVATQPKEATPPDGLPVFVF